MKHEFLIEYYRFLKEVALPKAFYSFFLWMHTITDSQIKEVITKSGNLHVCRLLDISPLTDTYRGGGDSVAYLGGRVLSYRAECALLNESQLGEPMHRYDYIKFLLHTAVDIKYWEKASDEFLTLGMHSNNFIDDEGKPGFDPKVLELCRNIAAERAIFGDK